METFTEPKEPVENPLYENQKQKCLAGLSDEMIDAPLIDLINGFNTMPYCFTLQCCYGHFIYNHQQDPYNIEPLPVSDNIDRVKYKIAYLCICVDNNDSGRGLLEALKAVAGINPQYVQFCCAEWFWKKQVNSYALQVQPDRFKDQDTAILDYREALHIENIRNAFFAQLRELLQKQQRVNASR